MLMIARLILTQRWFRVHLQPMNKLTISALSSGVLFTLSVVGCGSAPPAESPPAQSQSQAVTGPTLAPPAQPRAVNAGSCPREGLVDDFEDGNNRAQMNDGRGGYWYTYNDPSSTVAPQGTFTASEGGYNASAFSGRMSGKVGAQQYPYVGMGVSMTDPKQAYDLSCCEGVSFWGKKTGDGISNVRLKVGDWQTDPAGGSCKECYNDFGADFSFTDEWQEFSIKFSEMKQEPYWGEPKVSIDTAAIYQLQWQVKENNRVFDIQIDNVRLTGCGGA